MRSFKILIEILLSALLLIFTAIPAYASSVKTEPLLPKLVYVPPSQEGYQDLVVQEMFSSNCYRPAREAIRIDFLAKKVYIADQARHYQRNDCAVGFTGYMKKVSLGRLPAGSYDLFFEFPTGNALKVSTFTVQAP